MKTVLFYVVAICLLAGIANAERVIESGGGSGDVSSSASSATDNTLVRTDGTSGKTVQTSNVVVSDADAISGVTQLSVDNITLDANAVSISSANGSLTLSSNGSGAVAIVGPATFSSDVTFAQGAQIFSSGRGGFVMTADGTMDIRTNAGSASSGGILGNYAQFFSGATKKAISDSSGFESASDSYFGFSATTTASGNPDTRMTRRASGDVKIGTAVGTAGALSLGSSNAVLSDSAGTLTLNGLDALDATSTTTISNAITSLPNLTSAGATTFGSGLKVTGAYTAQTATNSGYLGESGGTLTLLSQGTGVSTRGRIALSVQESDQGNQLSWIIDSDGSLRYAGAASVPLIIADGSVKLATSNLVSWSDSSDADSGDQTYLSQPSVGKVRVYAAAANTSGALQVGAEDVITNTTGTVALSNIDTVAYTSMSRSRWIPASAMTPSTTNGCASLSTREIAAGQPDVSFFGCDASTQEAVQFVVQWGDAYALGTITAQFYWTASNGTGDAIWGMQCVAVSDNDTINTTYGTAQTVTDTLLATNKMHVTSATSAITIGGTPADGDAILCRGYRDAAAGGDTLNADAELLGVRMKFTADQEAE